MTMPNIEVEVSVHNVPDAAVWGLAYQWVNTEDVTIWTPMGAPAPKLLVTITLLNGAPDV